MLPTTTAPTDPTGDPPGKDETLVRPASAPSRGRHLRLHRAAMRPRRALVKVHRWLSFAVIAWVVVVAVTGGWLVFSDAYGAKLRPELYRSTGSGDVGMEQALDVARERLPEDGYLSYAVLPVNGRGVYQVEAAWPDPDAAPPVGDALPEEIYRTFYVDPGTGELNGTTDYEEGFTWWMYRGHMYLWQDQGPFEVFDPNHGWCRAGADGQEPGGLHGVACDVIPDGMDTVGWFATAWIVVLLTGLYLWYWPGVRRWATALLVRRDRGAFAFNLSVHRVVGLLFWAPLVVIAFTGAAFAFPNLRGWFQNATPAERGAELWVAPDDAVSAEPTTAAEPLAADQFLSALQTQFPGRRIDSIMGFPADGDDATATWQAWVDRGFSPWTREGGGGNTLVVADQFSGDVLYDGSPEEGNAFEQVWDDWSFPLHTGDFGGTLTRALWTLVAVSPLVLAGTGGAMYLVRLRKRRRAALRRSATDPSGSPGPDRVTATGADDPTFERAGTTA